MFHRLTMLHRHFCPRTPIRQFTTKPPSLEQTQHVLATTDSNLRSLRINRPQALNALNSDIIHSLSHHIKTWEHSPAAKIVTITGLGRAFCAGGDVVSLVKLAQSTNRQDRIQSVNFFRDEYTLDSFISKMKTPIVCFLDGITMGGGMGLCMHTPFRVATENTRVAMPETGIGLFPDVGATFFLPRLDGEIGTYLGLTGTSLYGWGAFQAGIASHYIPSNSIARLEERLTALSADATHERINEAIEEFAADPAEVQSVERQGSQVYDLKGTKRQAIDHCFGPDSIDQILQRLQQVRDGYLFSEDSSLKNWAHQTIDLVHMRSPSSLKITLQALRLGRKLSIDQCFEMEMKLAATCCDTETHLDFVTGVRHLLIEKQKTRAPWKPSELSLISDEETKEKYFSSRIAPTTQDIRLDLRTSAEGAGMTIGSYTEYPHLKFSLPTEDIVKKFVLGDVKGTSGNLAITKNELIQTLNSLYKHKIGLSEKVTDILDRKAITLGPNHGHVLKWQY